MTAGSWHVFDDREQLGGGNQAKPGLGGGDPCCGVPAPVENGNLVHRARRCELAQSEPSASGSLMHGGQRASLDHDEVRARVPPKRHDTADLHDPQPRAGDQHVEALVVERGQQRDRRQRASIPCHAREYRLIQRPTRSRPYPRAMYVLELLFDDNPQRLAARPAHREHLAQLHAAGRLLAAGPWHDGSGALLIFDTDLEGVHAAMATDPYYTTPGVTVAALREWEPIVGIHPST